TLNVTRFSQVTANDLIVAGGSVNLSSGGDVTGANTSIGINTGTATVTVTRAGAPPPSPTTIQTRTRVTADMTRRRTTHSGGGGGGNNDRRDRQPHRRKHQLHRDGQRERRGIDLERGQHPCRLGCVRHVEHYGRRQGRRHRRLRRQRLVRHGQRKRRRVDVD